MEAGSLTMFTAAKIPVLNPGEFELWKMRIEQYFLMTDYALWEVIVNGDSPSPKRTVDGVEKTYPPTTVKEKLARKNELKARGTLLMALPNEHQLKFSTYKCAKTLMEAIEKRFGGNKESKKTQKTLLKQQYENFNGSSSEGLDQTYDKMQKLISQLEILGETISQEDIRSSSSNQNLQNVAFVSSNNSGSSNQTHGSNSVNTDIMNNAVIYSSILIIDADDLEEMDLKWLMAMLTMRARRFLNKTRMKINPNGSETIRFNKSKVECYNCHKKGHFTRECRAPRENRNREAIRRNVIVETTETKALVAQDRLGYDWSDQAEEGPTNFALMVYTSLGSLSSSSSDSELSTCSKACAYKAGLESIGAILDMYKKNEVVFEEDIKILKLDNKLRDNALTEHRKKFEKAEKERDDLKLTLEKFRNSSKNLRKLLEIQVSDKFKTDVRFDSQVVNSHVFDSQENESIPNAATTEAKTSVSKPKSVGEPLIEDWISDSEDENEIEFKSKQRKPSFAKTEFVISNKHVKTPRESVKKVENKKQAKYSRKNSQIPRGNQRNWNNLVTQKLGSNFEFKNKACYECGSFNHLIKDCDLYEKKMVEKTVWNNARRANHQNSQRMTHPHPKGIFVPTAILMKSGIKSLNTVGQNFSKAIVSVNTGIPINPANVLNKAHTHVRRPFNKSITNKNSNLKEQVNTVKRDVIIAGPKVVVSENKGNEANAVKASACWVWRRKQKVLDHGNQQLELQGKGVIDSGCSRYMTGNISHLSDYEEINSGFVTFGGDPKGGRITGKGKISIGKLDFEDVYFVKELKFNLFSVSQMCDKKNSVLFTDTECVVLSPDFKLLDENHVLLRVPRKDNMYSVDLKNIVPSGDLKVKVIRCDNGTEFKNKVMNQFCEMKGIKKEFSVARTPQQNGAEAVNNACYVQNRVLVIKPHNKTAYERFLGRKPALSFMRPFGCPVTILNTLDHLGKFDGKADEGFFVGYYTNSKAYRDSLDAGFKPSGEEEKIDSEHQENEDKNNVVDENIVYGCIDDPNMPNLEEIVYSDDDEEVGVEADMNNLATNVPVCPILTTRVHKDHPLE
ncbi:putative ribonuclease H-like domain-containing protein [Tanacetum coccineum]